MRRWWQARWVLGLGAFTLIGTLSFFYHYLNDRAVGATGTAGARALEEYTGAYAAGLAFIGVVWMARRWPLRRGAWRKPVFLYLGALPVFGVVCTTLMLESRDLLSPLLGMGAYHYGDLWWRYPMEFANQVMVYAVMVGWICLRQLYIDNREHERQTAELKQRLTEAQLEQLRLRLQPHFLFNTLNTISAVMYEDVGRADAMLTRLSTLLRHTLEASETAAGEVTLGHEIETCRLYSGLMQARFEQGLEVAYDITPAAEAARVPQFLLQPLLENAMRHGGGRIRVRAEAEGKQLRIEVSDTGREAMAAAADASGHGIGLASTGQRLQQMYGPGHSFQFGPAAGGGFSVRMRLPLAV
ncbi:MAG: sensor histidine kinase [Terriglobales bacterium]